jgi:serine/threonine protein kinase
VAMEELSSVFNQHCLICYRRWILERKLASSGVPKEEQINMIKDLERKETEFMRLKRNKISVDDFELLTIIGRGAFGEVRLCRERKSGNIYAMKKLKKSEMVMRGQVKFVNNWNDVPQLKLIIFMLVSEFTYMSVSSSII